MSKVSLLMLTMNRSKLTKKCFETNITNTLGLHELEILIADNGSAESEVIEWGARTAHYHRVNKKNEGISKAFGQLYLRSTGDYIVLLGNDIINSSNWLHKAICYLNDMPNAGIVGFDWGHGGVPPISTKLGVTAHHLTPQLNRVFGTWVMKRRLIEEIGFFHEGFAEYGLEDSDFNERVNLAGFNSFYIPDCKSQHLGTGEHDNGAYRQMKNISMSINAGIFGERCKHFQTKGVREPLPEMREPI